MVSFKKPNPLHVSVSPVVPSVVKTRWIRHMQVQHLCSVTLNHQPWFRLEESEFPDLILSGRDCFREFEIRSMNISEIRVGALVHLVDHSITEFYIDTSSRPNVPGDKVQLDLFTTSDSTICLYLESSGIKIVVYPTMFPVVFRRCYPACAWSMIKY